MIDETPRRIPLSQVVEQLTELQRANYEALLESAIKRIEELPESFDATKRALIEDVRRTLAADLERFAYEVAALAARGMRMDEGLH